MFSIYVGNLSHDVTEEQVKDLFGQYGAVTRTNLVMDRVTGESREIAFVDMANDAEGESAIEALDGHELNGMALQVSKARTAAPGERRPRRMGGPGRGGERSSVKNIFVTNIADEVSEEDLRELFAHYGEVGRVRLVTHPETDRPRGFAFVDMADELDRYTAIRAMDAYDLCGRPLSVFEARPQRMRPPRR